MDSSLEASLAAHAHVEIKKDDLYLPASKAPVYPAAPDDIREYVRNAMNKWTPLSQPRATSSTSLTDSSATVYVAGVVLGLGSLGAGGDRRLAVALVGYRCSTCLFNGCSTIL